MCKNFPLGPAEDLLKFKKSGWFAKKGDFKLFMGTTKEHIFFFLENRYKIAKFVLFRVTKHTNFLNFGKSLGKGTDFIFFG